MQKPAAIAAQLVDVRNVGMHKVVKLTVHVPEEQAGLVFEAFGWPTTSNPVPVALARLQESGGSRAPARGAGHATSPEGTSDPASPRSTRPKQSWHDMSPAQQAGVLCNDLAFQRFLFEHCHVTKAGADEAAGAIRYICNVKSRSDIASDSYAQERWRSLVADYRVWQGALV